MAEALKNMYDEHFLKSFSSVIEKSYEHFDRDRFIHSIIDESWEQLALKARMRKITEQLGEALPDSFHEAISILLKVNESCKGFPYLILPDFVELYGSNVEDWSLAMHALELFTQQSSAEFAVRPFIMRDCERMMEQMLIWTQHESVHVRRLASEGCRPSLPWGMALTMFKKDPSPIFLILERLKADSSLYVRKSVANNLNDISKHHPNLVVQIAKQWYGHNSHTNWIVRHGCRTLIKQAHPEVLELFGYAKNTDQEPFVAQAFIDVSPQTVEIGGSSEIKYRLNIHEGKAVHIRVEYGIYFVKANHKGTLKKFLLSDKTVAGGTTLEATRRHSWANLTTRKHYVGIHRIVLFVNGEQVAETQISLT